VADKDEAETTGEPAADASRDDLPGDNGQDHDGPSRRGASAVGGAADETGLADDTTSVGDEFGEPARGEPDGDPRELVEVSGRRAGGTGSSVAGAAGVSTTARPKKEPAPHPAPTAAPRTGPVKFVKESVGEMRKVVYPTGQQLLNYFVVVLVFVLFVITFVSLLDLAFGAAIFEVFG